jgi:hypothetical protein
VPNFILKESAGSSNIWDCFLEGVNMISVFLNRDLEPEPPSGGGRGGEIFRAPQLTAMHVTATAAKYQKKREAEERSERK